MKHKLSLLFLIAALYDYFLSLVLGVNKTLYSLLFLMFNFFAGTSTDVSRYAGEYEHVFETTTAGVIIQAPQVYYLYYHSIILYPPSTAAGLKKFIKYEKCFITISYNMFMFCTL